MGEECDEVKEELIAEIRDAVREFAEERDIGQARLLEREDPEKVASILYLFATGHSQNAMRRKYGFCYSTIARVIADYADYMGQWKQLGGKLASYNYLRLTSLEEQIIENIQGQFDRGEMEVGFRDLKELSIAKANASREALTARGEATQITEERKVATDEDIKQLMEEARMRLKEAKGVDNG